MNNNIKLFESKAARLVRNEAEQQFYVSVSDLVGFLADGTHPKAYWLQLKRRETQPVTDSHGSKLPSMGGKQQMERKRISKKSSEA